jgi:DNA topoisomerase-1
VTNLLIVESPAKAKKINSMLGSDWIVKASVGHVRDLPDGDMGVDVDKEFRLKYVATDRGKDVIRGLKEAVGKASTVYLGTDPDREGEAIAWHLAETLKLKGAKRITFGDVTEKAIRSALAAPRDVDMQLVRAQEARRAVDRLVGYTVSPILSDLTQVRRLSAGRVQSVALRLIVDREKEIRAFKPTNHFSVRLAFPGGWSADWNTAPFVTEDVPYVLDRALAEAVAKVRQVQVDAYREKEVKKSPKPPFITLSLQKAASRALGFNPKKTMDLAQKLKDAGHITYHRTDNPNVSAESMDDIRAEAAKAGIECVASQRMFKAAASAQEGHPAITPIHWDIEAAGDDSEQVALYKLIRIRAIASQLADAKFIQRSTTLSGFLDDGAQVEFKATGRTLLYPGWLALDPEAIDEDQEEQEGEGGAVSDDSSNPIPELVTGSSTLADDGELRAIKTKAPNRYTEPSLLEKLDKDGIGRPSTYAQIIDSITKRDYAAIKKRFFYPNPIGEQVIDTLVGRFQFLEYSYTRDMELLLDAIAQGNSTYPVVMRMAYSQLSIETKAIAGAMAPAEVCPACGNPLRRIKGMNTKTKREYDFYGHDRAAECKQTYDAGADGKPKFVADPVETAACPECGDALRRITGSNGSKTYDFYAHERGAKCEKKYNTGADGLPKFVDDRPAAQTTPCPDCGKDLVRRAGVSKTTKKPYDFYAHGGGSTCTKTFNTGADGLPKFPPASAA